MYLLKGKLRLVTKCSSQGSRLSRQMVSSDSGKRAPKFWFGDARELCQKWKNDTRWCTANISLWLGEQTVL